MNQEEAGLVGEHIEVRPGRVLHIWQHKNKDDERPVMLFVHGAGGRKEVPPQQSLHSEAPSMSTAWLNLCWAIFVSRLAHRRVSSNGRRR